VDASLVELDRAVSELGALGFQIYSNVNGIPLDDPRFDSVAGRAASSQTRPGLRDAFCCSTTPSCA
jgi:hypothetical protein